MNIVKLSDTAKSVLNDSDYNKLMGHVNNRDLNSARIFIEDKIDQNIFSTKVDSSLMRYEKAKRLQTIDSIITEELIKTIDVNGARTISN